MRWLVPVLVFVAGCNNCNGSSSNAPDAGGGSTADAAPVVAADAAPKPRKAPTGGAEALAQISTEIDAQKATSGLPAAQRDRFIDLLLQRAELMGKASDLVRADELTKAWPEQHLARAKVLAATMRFVDAIAELDRATTAPKNEVNNLRFAILVGHGEYDEALAMQPAPIERLDALAIANAGLLAFKMQKKDEGRRLIALAMQKAEDDGAPLPYAWICFQQGMIYALAGDDVSAESWFGSAVNIVPQYAHAAVHLAPAQAPEAALAKLTEIAKTSDAPEVPHARAEILDRMNKKDEAKAAAAIAAKGYETFLAKLPEAFSDHAARFYLGVGNDPKKALHLARDNAKARPTEDAMDLWMATAAGAKETTEACTASRGMKELHYTSDRGRALANASCPDAGVH